MPIQDITGATNNALDASRMQAAVGAQNRQKIVAAGETVTGGVAEFRAKEQVKAALRAEGLDENLAVDPHTAMTAILQKRRDAASMDQEKYRQGEETSRSQDAQAAALARQESSQKSQMNLHTTPTAFENIGEAKSAALGRELPKLLAPAPSATSGGDLLPESFDPTDTAAALASPEFKANTSFREADRPTVIGRAGAADASGKPFRGESVAAAMGATKDTSALDEERRARAGKLVEETKHVGDPKGGPAKVVSQAMIDELGLPQDSLGEPSSAWVTIAEGKANRGARKTEADANRVAAMARLDKTLAARLEAAQGRMSDQDKQAIDGIQSEMANTFEPEKLKTMKGEIDAIIEKSRTAPAAGKKIGGGPTWDDFE